MAMPSPRVFSSSLCILVLAVSASLSAAAQAQAPDAFEIIDTINVDISPFGDKTSPDDGRIWVANSGGLSSNSNKVTIINPRTLTEDPDKITVGLFPEDIAFTTDGERAFVTNSTDGTVSVINTDRRVVVQTVNLAPVTFPFGVVVGLDDQQVFVTSAGNNDIVVLDNSNPSKVTVKTTIATPGTTGRPVFRPGHAELLVPSVGTANPDGPPILLIVDPIQDKIVNQLALTGNTAFANAVAVTPDGRFAYVSLFDFSGGTGGVWVVDLETLKTVTVINTGDPGVFGIRTTHDGRFVFVTNFLKDTVVVIDPRTNTIVATIPVGDQPNDIAFNFAGTKALVTNQNDTTVSVISIPR
jgi:YVTN family beta-propeller protein